MNAATQLEPALQLFGELVRADDAVARELASSSQELFRGPLPGAAGTPEAALAERRHLEWFVLERHSPALFGVPAEHWRDRARAAAAELEQGLDALAESFTGIFVVTEVQPGEGAWVQDLAGFGDYALSEPEGAAFLEAGDLVVGRLFPIGEGLHQASPAAGVFRNAELVAALRKDLDAARASRAAKVLHVSQHELEPMFFSGPGLQARESDHVAGSEALRGELSVTDPVGEARLFLLGAGLTEGLVDEVLRELAAAPFQPERLVHGAHDTLGDILDTLAFETGVDLVRARSLLHQAWARMGARSEEARAPRPAGDPRTAVEAFTAGRTRGEDVDKLITDLERELELDTPEEPDPEELAPAPDFPGVVGAMVDEFLWEVGARAGDPSGAGSGPEPDDRGAARLAHLKLLAEFAERIGVFEELSAAELLRFTTFWIHEREAIATPDEALDLLEALERFCKWTAEAHAMELADEFAPTLQRLRSSLPRIVLANSALARPVSGEQGELFELRGASAADVRVVGRDGEEHAVANSALLAASLREGDRLRGRIGSDGELRVFRCYPPEAAQLLA